jgi:hypothetical protein
MLPRGSGGRSAPSAHLRSNKGLATLRDKFGAWESVTPPISAFEGRAGDVFGLGNVCRWHFSDVAGLTNDVGFWGVKRTYGRYHANDVNDPIAVILARRNLTIHTERFDLRGLAVVIWRLVP